MLNPIEWLVWIYGKWFVNQPWRGFFTVVVVSCMVLSLIIGALWLKAVDEYGEKHPKQGTVTASNSAPPDVTVQQGASSQGTQRGTIQSAETGKKTGQQKAKLTAEGSTAPKTSLKHTAAESKPVPTANEDKPAGPRRLPVVTETFPPDEPGEQYPRSNSGYIIEGTKNSTFQNNSGVATIARGGYVEDSKFIDTTGAGNTIENEGRMERTLVQGSKNVVINTPTGEMSDTTITETQPITETQSYPYRYLTDIDKTQFIAHLAGFTSKVRLGIIADTSDGVPLVLQLYKTLKGAGVNVDHRIPLRSWISGPVSGIQVAFHGKASNEKTMSFAKTPQLGILVAALESANLQVVVHPDPSLPEGLLDITVSFNPADKPR